MLKVSVREVATRASRSLRMARMRTERSLENCGSRGAFSGSGELSLGAAVLELVVLEGGARCREERRWRSSSSRPACEQMLM